MERVERDGDGFIVHTTSGVHRARSVLLAIGRRGSPRTQGVPGEDLPKVVYRLIESEQYRGKSVLVVGGGDSALEAALALAGEPDVRVLLSYRGAAFSRAKEANRQGLEQAVAQGRIELHLGSEVEEITPREVRLQTAGGPLVTSNDAVIVSIGGQLPMPLLQQVGIEFKTKHGSA
jgi:thioredoxin reductase